MSEWEKEESGAGRSQPERSLVGRAGGNKAFWAHTRSCQSQMSSSSEQQLKQSEITKNHFSFHHSSSNATSDSFPLEPVVLGEGSFSSVYLATHKPSGRVCALKCVYKKELMRQAARQQQSSHRTTVVDLIKREKFVLQLVGGLIKPKRFHFGSDIGDGSDGDDTTSKYPIQLQSLLI